MIVQAIQVPELPGQLLFNVTDAGKILGMSRWSVMDLMNSGELGFIPRGRKGRRIPLFAINDWLKKRTVYGKEGLRRALDGRRKS